MRKTVFFFFLITFFIASNSNAQTLFTYGKESVSKQEFLKAFKKNNNEKSTSEKSYRNYLELYIRFKLKVQAAYEMKLDTLKTQQTELQNFRNQVADSYVNDNASMNKLVNQAFERSLKDIHLAHIFIAAPKNATPVDTLKAFQKANAVYADLKNGKNFGDVAAQYSDDATAKQNHGDIGYITVFTLPYDLENLVYTTLPGKFSKIFRSNAGYHIFKNLGERKAIGKIRAAQILFVFPPNAPDAVKADLKKQADSVYALLKNGVDFGELAKKYSGDNLSYQTKGELAEFGVGKYEKAFEDAAFSLKNNGDFTEPVLTSFGYHIIKRLKANPVSTTANKQTIDGIKQLVLADPRVNISKKILLQKILTETNFKRAQVDENSLWIITDSALRNKPLQSLNGINNSTVLFSFPKKNIVVTDWLTYVKTARNIPALSSGKTYKEVYEQYLQTTLFEYYKNHLEDYNKDFAYQLNEFKEGNMLFEIMQRKIWNVASTDSIGLKNYFDANKNKYWWDASADAIVFTCNNETAANNVKNKLQTNIDGWKKLLDASDGSTQADSGRFLLPQLPMAEKGFHENQFTSFVVNQPDNTVTFAYIIKMYSERSPRNFSEARGLVTNDYQNYLEDKWIEELKKKYGVKVDEAVFKSLK
ncbi:MAG TPA: peptidylprolyl isomerase [Puia sp.]|jgi:peptidyl-prolyl cis-trans isomerase SurA|nr:peptidylprolyl isomerase [Puia sp.]